MPGEYFYLGPDIEIEGGKPQLFRFEFSEALTAVQIQALKVYNYSLAALDELKPAGAFVYDFLFTPWGVTMSQQIARDVEARARSIGAEIKAFTLEGVDEIAAAAPKVGYSLFAAGWPLLFGLVLVYGILYEVKR